MDMAKSRNFSRKVHFLTNEKWHFGGKFLWRLTIVTTIIQNYKLLYVAQCLEQVESETESIYVGLSVIVDFLT